MYNLNLDNFATFKITIKGKEYLLEAPCLDNALEFEALFEEFFSNEVAVKDGKKRKKTSKDIVEGFHKIINRLFVDKEEAKLIAGQLNMVQAMHLVSHAYQLYGGKVDESLKQEDKKSAE